jgi:hypothetical protein
MQSPYLIEATRLAVHRILCTGNQTCSRVNRNLVFIG